MCRLIVFIVILTTTTKCFADTDVQKVKEPNVETTENNQQQTTANPYSSSTNKPSTTTDSDYWDNDDYVPLRNDRHDEFDWKLLKATLKSNNSNIVLSPFSVKLLLSLLSEAAGRNTSTHRELSTVLPKIITPIQAREYYGAIFKSLMVKSDDYELNVGTKIYVDGFITPRQRFAAIIESYYATKIETIDFKNTTPSANLINEWCSQVTRGHIQKLVTPEDIEDSIMIMINAIYFNGYWRKPFPENATVELDFYASSQRIMKTNYMMQTAMFYIVENAKLKAKLLRLPYKGRKYAMTIILPNDRDGLDELLSNIDSVEYQRSQWLMDESEVNIVLPRFKFDHTILLNDNLKELGITSIFTNEASLPSLARGQDVQDRLQVSKVLQKAGIYVNERGSLAYAATQIQIVNKFGGDYPYEFVADHPFAFIIEDESTGTILFAGKVVDPAEFTV